MNRENEIFLYSLPLHVSSSLSWFFRIIFILGIVSVSSFVYFLTSGGIMRYSSMLDVTMLIFFILLDAYFLYALTYFDIARLGFIHITDEYLEFRDMFRHRKFLWDEIHSVDTYYFNRNTMLGIILKKNLSHKSLWKKINTAMGAPYDIRLSLSMFSSIDEDVLLLTIQNQLSISAMND